MTPIEMLYPAVNRPSNYRALQHNKSTTVAQQQAANSAETRGFVFVVGTTNSQQTHNCCSCAPSLRGRQLQHASQWDGTRTPFAESNAHAS